MWSPLAGNTLFPFERSAGTIDIAPDGNEEQRAQYQSEVCQRWRTLCRRLHPRLLFCAVVSFLRVCSSIQKPSHVCSGVQTEYSCAEYWEQVERADDFVVEVLARRNMFSTAPKADDAESAQPSRTEIDKLRCAAVGPRYCARLNPRFLCCWVVLLPRCVLALLQIS